MGRAFVRQAVTSWLSPPAVAGLNSVYATPPKWAPGEDFFAGAAAGTPSGAIAFIHLEDQQRRRIAWQGSQPGGKMSIFTVGLGFRFVSNAETSEDAQADHDATLDALVVRLEADKQLGTGPSLANPTPAEQLFQAGEGDAALGEDIHITSDLPKQTKTQIVIWSLVRFVVVEYIAGGTA